ncbi:MAG: hypothetical protein GY869_14560 [Planctomycetes bacterium]|nr:hypothetical protein [Planctomycetota bacterium]
MMNMEQEDFESNGVEETASDFQSWEQASGSELASAEAAEEEYAGPKKNFLNRGTLLIVASCLAGVGAIYLFSLRNQPKEVSAEMQTAEAEVDAQLQRLMDPGGRKKAQEMFKQTDEMVRVFYDYPTKQQVAVNDLQRDPFSRLLAEDKEANDEEEARQRLEKLRKELSKLSGELELQSVLKGLRSSQCMIDGDVYRVGDMVQGTFEVKEITDNQQVIMSASGMTFTIKMRRY